MRLTAAQRATLLQNLDFAALERLLETIPTAEHPTLLRFFRHWSDATTEDILKAFPELSLERHSRAMILPQPEDLAFDDPAKQELLRQVLANRAQAFRSVQRELRGDEA